MADLPIANISRIMKNALPDNAKIAKDAKECVQECVTEFIAFITSEGLLSPVSLSPCVAIYSFHLLRWTTRCIQAWLMRCVAWLGGCVLFIGGWLLFVCLLREERPWMAALYHVY